jgi:hypothetical protein
VADEALKKMPANTQVHINLDRWKTRALWVSFWVFYVITIVITEAAANLRGRGFGWLRILDRSWAFNILPVITVMLWISTRIALWARSESRWLTFGVVAAVELPVVFVVYIFWILSMIGGPINPG